MSVERYALIYDEQMKGGYSLFSYNGQEDFKEKLHSEAIGWSEINEESDYREFLFQKYGNDFHRANFEEEKDEFYTFVKCLLSEKNGYEYLNDSGFSIYKVNKDAYKIMCENFENSEKSRFHVNVSELQEKLGESGQSKYMVEVEETLSKIIEVEAFTATEACNVAREKYINEEIVLCSEDYNNEVTFKVMNHDH